jgi:CubicO group peptidase (beta-lactamase class C family)
MPDINPSLINWPQERPPYGNFAAAVQGENARWNAVGLAAGMVRAGERSISVTGFANADAGYPMRENNLFLIGSISKIYTATLVMKLAEEGLLDLDTPVVQYVPDFRLGHDDVRNAITMRMLLSHTSGFDGDRFTEYGRGDDSYQRAVDEFHSLTQWFQPGSFYSYNNAGFYLAGHIIQKLTGDSFEKVMTDRIIAPMGLKNTILLADDAINRAIAAGHIVDRVKGVSLTTARHLPRHANPAGGVMQSIGDLLTFAQMHLNLGEVNGTHIISRESAQQMQQPQIEADTYDRHYGIGWSIFQRPGSTTIGHGGSWGGHRANLILVPKHNFAHACLGNSNMSIYAYQSLEEWVLEHELHITKPRRESIDLSPLELDAYTGTYTRHDSRYVVTRTETGLRLAVTDIDEDTGKEGDLPRLFDLEPLEAGRFRVTSPESRDATVDFRPVPDAGGTSRDLLRIWGRVAARSPQGGE